MSITRSAIGWFTGSSISAALTFLAIIYFSRELGPKILGVYFLFSSILNLLNLFANVGLKDATTKRISEKTSSSEFFTASLVIRLVPFCILSLGVFLARSFLDSFIGAELSLFLIVLLGFLQFSDLMRETLEGEGKVGTSAFVDLAQVVGRISTQIILVAIGAGIYGLIAGLNIGMLVSIVIGVFLIEVKICRPKREHFRSILKFSKYSFGNALGGYLYEWVDIIIIGLFLTQELVGIYGVCWVISAGFLLSSYAVVNSIYPRISELSVEGRKEEISKIFKEGLVYSSVLAIPAMVGILIISEDFLGIVYGEAFRKGYLVLIILMLARVFQSLQMVSERVIEGMDRPDIVFNIKIITALVNIFGTFALVYWLGFVGAAIATALTMGISFVFNTRRVLEILEVRFPYREVFYVLISAGMMGVFVWLVSSIALFNDAVNLILTIIGGAIVYSTFLLLISKNIRNKIFRLGIERVDI